MNISTNSLSKIRKMFVLASLFFILLLILNAFSSATTPVESLQKLLQDAGYANDNIDKFIMREETPPNEQPITSQNLQAQSDTVQLQIVPTGIGLGTINTLDGKIKSCTTLNTGGCSAEYAQGSSITLIVSPSSDTTIVFPNADCTTITADTCTLTLNTAKILQIQLNAQTPPAFATYLISPYPRQILFQSGTVTLQADVINTLHPGTNVDFFVQKKGTPTPKNLGTDSVAPYEVQWIPLEVGEYEISTSLKSTDGWTTSSPKVPIQINESSLVPECIDRDDGIKPTIKSSMTSAGYTYTDNCIDTMNVYEFFCNQARPEGKLVPCSIGCSQGACIASLPTIRTKTSTTGLLGWFSSDEDPEFFHGLDSSNGKNLEAIGNISIAVEEGNPSYVFDGNSYAQIAQASFPFNYPAIGKSTTNDDYNLSVSLWFNTQEKSGVLLGQSAISGGNNGYPPAIPVQGAVPAIYIGSDGKLRVSLFWDGFPPGDNGGRYVSDTAVTDSLWHNIVITYANKTESVYLDGKKVNIRKFTQQVYASDYAYTLGTGYAFGWDSSATGWMYYKGKIDKLALYGYNGKTLSDDDVTQLFAEGRAGVVPTVAEPPTTPPAPSPSPSPAPSGGSSGSSSGGGGGGGGYVPVEIIIKPTHTPKTIEVTNDQLQTGINLTLAKEDTVQFSLNQTPHHITLLEIVNATAFLEVASQIQKINLILGQTQDLDITEDTRNDITLKLVKIDNETITLQLRALPPPEEKKPETPTASRFTGRAILDFAKTEFKKLSVEEKSLIGIVIVLLIIYLLLGRKARRNVQKKRRK